MSSGAAWMVLLIAGLAEMGWMVGLKLAHGTTRAVVLGFGLAIGCMALSMFLLYLVQRVIPIGLAYAVWTGIGAAGTFLLGVFVFGDAASPMRFFGVGLIVAGVAALRWGS